MKRTRRPPPVPTRAAPVRTVSLLGALVWIAAGRCALAPAHAAPPIAGYVSAIDGRESECLIVRGKKTLPARYWADLLVGDEVVAKGQCRIEIMPRDGPRRWTVMETNSPTPMTDRARRQTALPVALEPLGAALTKWNADLWPPLPKPEPPARPRRGRGKAQVAVQAAKPEPPKPPPPVPLAIPLLTGPGLQRLLLAARRFNLAWVGGKPPFTVTLEPAGEGPDTAPPWTFQIGEERVVSSMIAPHPGPYAVRVADAAGTVARGQFEVVETPPTIDWHDLDALPREIASVVAAARLASQDGGVWRLEAHARLADLGRDDYAAALMEGQLREGKSLPAPPALDAPGPSGPGPSGPGPSGRGPSGPRAAIATTSAPGAAGR